MTPPSYVQETIVTKTTTPPEGFAVWTIAQFKKEDTLRLKELLAYSLGIDSETVDSSPSLIKGEMSIGNETMSPESYVNKLYDKLKQEILKCKLSGKVSVRYSGDKN